VSSEYACHLSPDPCRLPPDPCRLPPECLFFAVNVFYPESVKFISKLHLNLKIPNMKFKALLSIPLVASSLFSFAQDGNRTFAITGDGNGDYMWMNIREVNLANGEVSKNLFERTATNYQLLDATTKKPLQLTPDANRSWMAPQNPTGTLVAAAAYDKRHDKLFFTPMRIGELRWLDLGARGSEPKFYTLQTQLLNPADLNNEANHITRMVIAADGNGYAITNDGNHLIRFTTGRKVTITDLGNLVDAESNGGISIHNKCSSWGGDMVADADGSLLLISANQHVFSINLDTRVATHKGVITGLPARFTTNGAAVDADGNVVVTSANSFEGYFKVDLKNLTATKLPSEGKIYNASDLANSNLLNAKKGSDFGSADLRPTAIGNDFISIYPNPVTANNFKITFDNKAAGEYNVAVTDLQGRVIMSKQVFVVSPNQVEMIKLKSKPASGMYMVRVVDANQKQVFTQKLVVE
jgi:hypothetical protein